MTNKTGGPAFPAPAGVAQYCHLDTCGLDNIYLVNGFRHITHNGLKTVVIDDEPELFQAIGQYLCGKAFLTGKEFRFLRSEMRMTQSRIAAVLGVSDQMVYLWEKRSSIPKLTVALVKAIYLDSIDIGYQMKELLMADETPKPEKVYFRIGDGQTWNQVEAK